MPQTFHTVILGGGPGGTAAAEKLAKAGKSAALVSNDLGGECLNFGCIPSKTYLYAAELFEKIAQAETFGISGANNAQLNWEFMKKRKNDVVAKLKKGLEFSLTKAGVKIFNGMGAFDGMHEVHVNSEVLTGEFIIVATGSEPKFPPGFSKSDRVLTNREILDLPTFPKTLLIIGGGAIGCEFASIFSALGTKITIAESDSRLLPQEDPDISTELERVFARKNINILKNTKISADQTNDYEKVLIATGRQPVAPNFQPAPHIHVIGDALGKALLAYTAEREGEIAAAKILGENPSPLQYEFVANTIFSIPEIASVGLTEEEVKAKNIACAIGKGLYSANSKALIVGSRDGFAKIIAEKSTKKILGVHIIGEKAAELIAEASLALSLGLTLDQFSANLHSHPILGEVLKEAIP